MRRNLNTLQHAHVSRRIFGAVLVLGILAGGCGHKIEPGEVAIPAEEVAYAATEMVAEMPLGAFHPAPGTVRARKMTVVSSQVMAAIEDVPVEEGDRVEKGQVLVRLRSAEMDARLGQGEAAVAAAEATLKTAEKAVEEARAGKNLAEATLARYRKLHEARAVSDQEFDIVETQARVAESALGRMEAGAAAARAALGQAREARNEAGIFRDFTVIDAPHAGRITARLADPGTIAAPGVPLLHIASEPYQLEVPLEEGLLGQVSPGDAATVSIPAAALEGSAKVLAVVPAVDERSRTFMVKFELPHAWQERLGEGLYGTAQIPLPEVRRISVPVAAIVRHGQTESVYVVDEGGRVGLRLVRAGRQDGPRVEILSGLRPGERVVVEGVSRMRDGAVMKAPAARS